MTTLDFSVPRLLRNEKEYDAAVAEMTTLLRGAHAEGSMAYDRLEFLAVLVEAYENEHVRQLKPGTPQDVVDFMLDQKGMVRGDLAPYMGGRGRVSDFFTGRRPNLSVGQIRALREVLGIPADLLLGV